MIDIGDHAGPKIVVIFRITREFKYQNQACTRTQVPIVLAYVITVYNAQRLSLDCVVSHLSNDKFNIGLLYIAGPLLLGSNDRAAVSNSGPGAQGYREREREECGDADTPTGPAKEIARSRI